MSKLVDIQNLKISFQNDHTVFTAVHNSSFSIEKSEIVAIVGESGSGKSVSSLAMMGLLPKKTLLEGSILYYEEGKPCDLLKINQNHNNHFRGKKIAMIFQEPMSSLNPVMRCGKQLLEAIRLHKSLATAQEKPEVIRLFNAVELPDPERIFNAYPHELSGGQRQRVMIAMAIASEPELLIADEPTTALDVTVQKNILHLLKKLQQVTGMSILFITHDLGVVAELADRVLVMHKGSIVEQGNTKEIFSAAKHPYTKGLLACRPPLEKNYKKLAAVSDFLSLDAKGNFVEQELSENWEDSLLWKADEQKLHRENIYSNEALLEVKNLHTSFVSKSGFFNQNKKEVRAVDNVSFSLFPGETLGLVGESGCGKSTLGRTILRLIEQKSGEIIYKGKDISKLSKDAMKSLRSELQIIFQDPYASLNPRMTVGQCLVEAMENHQVLKNTDERKKRAYELLEQVGLSTSHYDHFPHEFSGGQRQRVGIARAIATNPKFIICDESVSALDVSVQAQVLNLLNELKERYQLSYLFISHDMSVVKFMSDRMIVMNKGKIEESGTPEAIFSNPSSAYTKKLIAAIPS